MNRITRIILGIILVAIGILALVRLYSNVNFSATYLLNLFKLNDKNFGIQRQNIVYEESVIIDVVDKSLPSVVTVGISTTRTENNLEIDPFNMFGGFRRTPGVQRKIEQNIGSGFIVSKNGLIITNKHVVSETEAV